MRPQKGRDILKAAADTLRPAGDAFGNGDRLFRSKRFVPGSYRYLKKAPGRAGGAFISLRSLRGAGVFLVERRQPGSNRKNL